MKVKKDIDRLIFIKAIEILLVIGFVFIATPMWGNQKNQNLFATSIAATPLSYTNMRIDNPINYSLFPMQDDDALSNLDPCYIEVINATSISEFYTLFLKVSKNSTLDYTYLNIAIDDRIYSLKDLTIKEENENYYFLLDENTIKSSKKNYEVRLWLNTFAENDMQSKDLIFSFEIRNGAIKM